MQTSPHPKMEPLISSDAVAETFSKGVAIKLSDCSPKFQLYFSDAREAIVEKKQVSFEAAVKKLLNYRPDESDASDLEVLNVYEEIRDGRLRYPMTLLAYAGYHDQTDMINYLITKGANVDMGKPRCGTPLLQMFLYAHRQQMKEKLERPKININIVELFINSGAHLNRIISAGYSFNCSILTLAFSFHLFDIAKLVIKNRLDPIWGGDGEICPVFLEYYVFGTHNLLKWLLEEHYSANFKDFVHRLLDEDAFYKPEQVHSFQVLGKNATHAFLLCGHEEAIDCLVKENIRRRQSQPESNPDILKEVDAFQKTALHLAAEDGDITSVKILLKHCGPDNVNVEDSSSMTPIMLATMNRHAEVVKLLQPLSLASRSTDGIKKEIFWALHYGYDSYFEAMHATKEGEERLLAPVDNNGNTIAHLAVERGLVSIFKATFPRTRRTDSHSPLFAILSKENSPPQKKTPLQIAIEKGNIDMLNALLERRDERKKQVKKDDVLQQQAEIYEVKVWKKFWDEESPGLLLYACLHGTVEIVDYFVTKHVSPTTNICDRTPLSCAAQAGKSEIVAYLLSIDIPTTGYLPTEPEVPDKYSPLILASRFGRSACAAVLLDKGASIDVRSERRYNCLMEAIKAGHKDTAAALLKHNWPGQEWMKAMNCRVQKQDTNMFVDPLIMLIKEMPDVASRVFTQCIIPDKVNKSLEYNYYFLEEHIKQKVDEAVSANNSTRTPPTQTPGTQLTTQTPGTQVTTQATGVHSTGGAPATTQTTQVTTQATGIQSGTEATTSLTNQLAATNPVVTQTSDPASETPWWLKYKDPKETEKQDDPPSHPLELMVLHKRLDLLQHPLISRYISSKWLRLSPLLFGYLFLYIIFLILLTSFALRIPRPGPDNEYCPSNDSGSAYVNLSLRDGECKEPKVEERRAFTALAVLIIPLSLLFFVLHIVLSISTFMTKPLWPGFPTIVEAILRPFTFIFTIIFVFGFVNDCWCAPPWQWQIGALAVFMAYINLILLLKGMPWLGIYINMLLKIVIEFMKLILLPFFLILSFAFPFYMLFVRDAAGKQSVGILEAFSSPAHSIAKAIVQTTGELDFETLFNDADLLYSPMAYILFFSFVILMPILFLNLLVGLAVGTTDTDLKDATFNKIALQVSYISAIEALSTRLRILVHRTTHHLPGRWASLPSRVYKGKKFLDKLRGVDYDTLNKLLVDDLYNDEFNKDGMDTTEEQHNDNTTVREYIDKCQQALQSDIRDIQCDIKVVKEMLQELRKTPV